MKYVKSLPILFLSCSLVGSVSAATTTYNGAVGGDINVAANWDSGLPSNTNLGTVSRTTTWSDSTLNDFDFILNGNATLTRATDFLPEVRGDSNITIENATMDVQAGPGKRVLRLKDTASITLNTGGLLKLRSDRNLEFSNTATVALNGGTVVARSLNISAVSVPNDFAIITLQSGTLDLVNTFTFGVDGLGDPKTGYINFTSGSTASLDIANADAAYYEGLWDNGNLKIEGANTGTFAENFVVTGGVLTVAVPEPSSTALLGLGGLALILRRRK